MKIFVLGFLGFCFTSTFAATLNVSPSGFYLGFPCYTTIQSAINASIVGDKIAIHAGTYQENVIVDRSLTISGDGPGSTFVLPGISDTGNPADAGSGIAGSDVFLIQSSNVTIQNLTVNGSNPSLVGPSAVVNGITINARNGIIMDFRTATGYTDLVVDNVTVKNIFERGIEVVNSYFVSTGNIIQNCAFDNIEGNTGSFGLLSYWSDVMVKNNTAVHATLASNWGNTVTFTGNTISKSYAGIQCSNVSGGTINNNTIDSRLDGSYGIYVFQSQTTNNVFNNVINNCGYGILVLGSYSAQNVNLTDNSINGFTGGFAPLGNTVGIYTTTEVPGYTPGNSIKVNISGTNQVQNVVTGIIIESSNAQRDDIGGPIVGTSAGSFKNNTVLNGLKFISISGNYIQLQVQGGSSYIPNIDATNVSFDSYTTSMADGFVIEDKILHKMDDPSLSLSTLDGLVTFIDKQLFVTGNTGNTFIQRAINAAPADGWTMNIKSGPTYAETVSVDRTISYQSDGLNTVNGIIMSGPGKTLLLNNNLSVTNTLTLNNGLITTGINRLILQNGISVSGASDASYVYGTLEKVGNAAFTFPVGDASFYRPCAMSAPTTATDAYTASYFGVSPRSTIAPAAISSPGIPVMLFVSDKEYWDVERTSGSSAVTISLTWRDPTISGNKSSDNDLVVASHDAAGWSNLGGNPSTGAGLVWVASSSPVASFGPFALGSISGATTLPLHFTKISVQAKDNNTLLSWSAYFDIVPIRFNILRSNDGAHFDRIGTVVPGLDNKGGEYTYTDAAATQSYFYRVEAIEQNNKADFSSIVQLPLTNQNIGIICNDQFLLKLPVERAESNAYLNVMDISGKLVKQEQVRGMEIHIQIPSSGTYLFTISNAYGKILGKAKATIVVH